MQYYGPDLFTCARNRNHLNIQRRNLELQLEEIGLAHRGSATSYRFPSEVILVEASQVLSTHSPGHRRDMIDVWHFHLNHVSAICDSDLARILTYHSIHGLC